MCGSDLITASTTSFRWTCNFDDTEPGEKWCEIQQDTVNDQFDWTLQTGATPSFETGPVGAHTGTHYIFIEASRPRKRGDSAM